MNPKTITYKCEDKRVTVDRSDIGRTAGRRWFIVNGWPWIEVNNSIGRAERHQAASWIIGHFPVRMADGDVLNLRRENIIPLGGYYHVTERPLPEHKPTTNKTGYIGVSHDERMKEKPWVARICKHGKKVVIGWYATAEEAARAYDDEAIEGRGRRARLNFKGEA